MKSLLLIVVSLSCILVAPLSRAEYGRIGLYRDTSGTVNQITGGAGQLELYMLAIDPVLDGRPISSLRGFEALVSFQSPADFLLDAGFPVPSINVGNLGNFIVGFGEPVPVSYGATLIATLLVQTLGQPESNIFLGPSQPPSHNGYLTVLDGEFNEVLMEPSSGDPLRPVFLINSDGLIQSASWGATKSLFR